MDWQTGKIYYSPKYGDGNLAVCIQDGSGDVDMKIVTGDLVAEPPVILMLTGNLAGMVFSQANPDYWDDRLKAPDALLSDTLMQMRQTETDRTVT